MAYTTIDKPTDYFRTKLYSGNNNAQNIAWDETDTNMQPDLLWIKSRAGTSVFDHVLGDSVRGGGKYSIPNKTDAEVSNNNVINTFNTNGFSVGGATFVSEGGRTYVSWGWKAETSFTNDASGTGIGSIDSTGSVNTDAGFSIVSYTGTGSAGTIKHGLSTAPKMIIQKNRDETQPWWTYVESIGAGGQLRLNGTNAAGSDGATLWNSTAPTSSVFSVGDNTGTNGSSDKCIAYCFADVKGYSKFGSYTGNGNADGIFVYTGFKPAFVMLKNTATTSSWEIFDSKRNTFNPTAKAVFADSAGAEYDYTNRLDLLSNGFKLRTTSDVNGSGNSIIYMAFASNPLVTSTGIPTTAR